jgi:small acid-soluble spore protein I (minor)
MNFLIRQAITENVTGQTADEFQDIINDAIARGDEHLLPGLGVFLEKWWQDASVDDKQQFSSVLQKVFH